MKQRGFTLLELVMVIMITGVIAASVVVFLKPAIDSYFSSRRRADLTDMADTALRRMAKDIRGAVPNSIRTVTTSCFQLVPTVAGGRYRGAPDTVNGASVSFDSSVATNAFDVLSPLSQTPASGDWVVIGNQNGDDVYTGSSRGALSSVTTPAATAGVARITLAAPTQFPVGSDSGRFVVVADAEQSVFYNCVGNTLYRTKATFAANQAATCGMTSGLNVKIVATDVAPAGCTFVYDPNQGATQQGGFVWMHLTLSRDGEDVSLAHGVHVDNVP